MFDETIVAVYDTAAHAEAAVADLLAAGIPSSAITRSGGASPAGTSTQPVQEQGFWSRLFGGEPDQDTAVYDRSMQGGSTVVTVKVSEAHVTRVVDVLDSHHPIDLDDRASSYGLSQSTRYDTAATGLTGASAAGAAGETMRLSEERLAVGKRLVNKGGTRIRRYVVETPVEEHVSLHEERVILERRPVSGSQPVGTADFTEKTIEMTETAEEAVVAKNVFVTEEISLRKEATDRVETIRDTVRREDVEVEQVPGSSTSSTSTLGNPTTKPYGSTN